MNEIKNLIEQKSYEDAELLLQQMRRQKRELEKQKSVNAQNDQLAERPPNLWPAR